MRTAFVTYSRIRKISFWRLPILVWLCALISPLLIPPILADEYTAPPPFFAKVLEVTRSNSLIVQADAGARQQVVLAFLSIPKLDQPYGQRARQILEAQLKGRRVSVRPIGEPKSDYVVGLVYVRQNNFNLDFLRRGHAWLDYYQISHPAWRQAQLAARASARGLYADPHAMHPIEWALELNKASSIANATGAMQTDEDFAAALATTFIGHREQKIYVAANCLKVWSQWPRSAWIPITTTAGATSDGFQQIACE